MLYVDGLSTASKDGAEIYLQEPNGFELEITLKLDFKVTNNEAEYAALIAGLKLAQQMKVKNLIAYIDSQLVAMQFGGSYEVNEKSMIEYLSRVKQFVNGFEDFKLC